MMMNVQAVLKMDELHALSLNEDEEPIQNILGPPPVGA